MIDSQQSPTLDSARAALREVFGFDQFRAGQEAVVSRLMAGRSVLSIFPTGAGKSLCYQLPALLLDGVTLVISPLIALMKDQIDFLKAKGVAAARLDSTLTFEELKGVMDELRGGRLKMLYVAPERLASERFLQTLKRIRLSMVAVDEAHCISEWGHNFRPDYMKLAGLAKELGVGRVLALTATATPDVARDIARAFAIEEGDVIKTEFHRKNLILRVTGAGEEYGKAAVTRGRDGAAGGEDAVSAEAGSAETVGAGASAPRSGDGADGGAVGGGAPAAVAAYAADGDEGFGAGRPARVIPWRKAAGSDMRLALLLERIRSRPPGPTIVYVTLQKTAEQVAAFLSHQGLPARAYHAGLDGEARHIVQDWFMSSATAIVCATIAFGMGIDKSDIRYVYHYNLPKTLENYAQEIGRAGRDGGESTCELLAFMADRVALENFTYGDTPTARSLGGMLAEVLCGGGPGASHAAGGTFDISVYDLSGTFDIRPLVVETVLTYLELEGVIASTGPFYGTYKFKPLRTSAEMLARFEGERREFIRGMFKCAERAKIWWTLDLQKVMNATGADRGRIIAALNYLEEQGDLTLEVAEARLGYRRLKEVRLAADGESIPADSGIVELRELTKRLAAQFSQRELRDIQRVARVVQFAGHEGCRTKALLDYFGEPLEGDCGHCDICLGQRAGKLAEIEARDITDEEFKSIARLKAEQNAALATPRQLARFLCGINSPAASRAKLGRDPRFGMLAEVAFNVVMESLRA